MENKETPPNQLDPQPKCEQKSVPTLLELILKQEEPGGGKEKEDVLEMHGVLVPAISGPPVAVSDVTPTRLFHRPHRGRGTSSKCKKNNPNIEKRQAILKKLQSLLETLKPVPFIPPKILYFSKHEKLLKKIGLWDFVHIDFDTNIRIDLIAQLVATYDSKLRCSYVNKFRIAVNRTSLARALKFPVKRVKANAGGVVGVDLSSEVLAEEEIEFIEEIVSDWVLLHGDMWLIPSEVLKCVGRIKDGHPEEVDWAGLFWFMVEEELTRGEHLIDCYYASHLQNLIKSQHEEVFMLREANEEEEVFMLREANEEEEDRNNEIDVKVGGITEFQEEEGRVVEGLSMELMLGQNVGKKEEEVKNIEMMDAGKSEEEEEVEEQGQRLLDGKNNVEEHSIKSCSDIDDEKEKKTIEKAAEDDKVKNIEMMDAGKSEEVEEQGQWLLDGKNNVEEHSIKSCSDIDDEKEKKTIEKAAEDDKVKNIEMTDAGKSEEEKEVEEQGQWLLDGKNNVEEHSIKSCSDIDDEKEKKTIEKAAEDGFHVLQDYDALEGDGLTSNLLQATVGNQLDFSTQGQLCDLNSDMQNLASAPSFSNNAGEQYMVQENDISQHSLKDKNKNLRITDSWDHKPVGFGMCMEKMQQSVQMFKLMHKEKERTQQQLDRNQQLLLNELQGRDMMIEHLQKTKLEEIRTRDRELYRLQRELYLMSSILDGYKKAVKETQKAFAEYREKSQLPEEPLYIDAGFGGLMLSTTEIEKLHKKQEAEFTLNCLILEQKAKEAEEYFAGRFETYLEKVVFLNKKLTGLETVVKELAESYDEQKMKKKLQQS